MVKKEVSTIFRCAYCGSEYDNYDDADECQDFCHDSHEDPTQDIMGPFFICEMCNSKHYNKQEAVSCEHHHKEKDDTHYQQFIESENKRLLEKAANHKDQIKLQIFYVVEDMQ